MVPALGHGPLGATPLLGAGPISPLPPRCASRFARRSNGAIPAVCPSLSAGLDQQAAVAPALFAGRSLPGSAIDQRLRVVRADDDAEHSAGRASHQTESGSPVRPFVMGNREPIQRVGVAVGERPGITKDGASATEDPNAGQAIAKLVGFSDEIKLGDLRLRDLPNGAVRILDIHPGAGHAGDRALCRPVRRKPHLDLGAGSDALDCRPAAPLRASLRHRAGANREDGARQDKRGPHSRRPVSP